MPIAPGTWGSVPPVVIFMAVAYLLPGWVNIPVMALVAAAGCWWCIRYSPQMIEETGRKDPSQVVIDEVAGQAVTLLMVAFLAPGNICMNAGLAFVLFRLFDIVKCWPMSRLEKLPAGWGILADDLAAGVLAGAVFYIAYFTGLVDWAADIWACQGSPLNGTSAAVLGLVQGLTEFLPVSSSGHLVLFEDLLPDIDPDSPHMLMFDLAIHVGTVGAIAVVYYKSFGAMLGNLFKSIPDIGSPVKLYKKSPSVHILVAALVTTAVTFVLYKLFEEPLESARKLPLVAGMWAVTGTLLLVTDMRTRARMSLREFGFVAAIVVGVAQAAAILPGISRSGATICTAILLGLHRRWAIEYSFLIGIPAILGGAVITFAQEFGGIDPASLPIPALIIGMLTAFVSGVGALKILIKSSRKRKLKYFAFYCWILSASTGGYLLIAG